MPVVLNEENDGASKRYDIADVFTYLIVASRLPAYQIMNRHNDNLRPFEIAIRLLRDVAILHGYNGGGDYDDDYDDEDDENDNFESGDVLVRRIRTNDPTLTTLAVRNIRIFDWNKYDHPPSSYFRGFTQNTVKQATEALRTNHTIRSISCRYDLRYPRISNNGHRLQDDDRDNNNNNNNNNNDEQLRVTSNNVVTKQQERRFFEACVCLPRLESISLTGGNRWLISHLVTILETAKGLKRLTVRDVLIKSSSELYGLKRVLLLGGGRRAGAGLGYNGCGNSSSNNNNNKHTQSPAIPLESIELTIEDQTDRNDNYWSTDTNVDESPFDDLLEALMASPNLKAIKISKSILSRFNLRPVHDISKKTLLKLARYQSLSKLILVGLSVERGAIEAMCESLMERNGHLTHLEFSGCAFNHTVGQSGWNAMFRLIDHDPDIQIRASSLVYLRRRRQSEQEQQNDNENEYNNSNEWDRRPGLVQRPHHDFSFSLRDRDGADRHFQNRGMDIEYMLQEAGFFQLLRAGEQANVSDYIDVMVKVKVDSIALFYILREHPALCDQVELGLKVVDQGHSLKKIHESSIVPPKNKIPGYPEFNARTFQWQSICPTR